MKNPRNHLIMISPLRYDDILRNFKPVAPCHVFIINISDIFIMTLGVLFKFSQYISLPHILMGRDIKDIKKAAAVTPGPRQRYFYGKKFLM